jgi:hypothetical protein
MINKQTNIGTYRSSLTESDAKANFVRAVQDLCFKLNSILQGKNQTNKQTNLR